MVIAEVAGRVVSGERFRVNESVFAGFLAIDGRKGEGGVLVGGHAGDCGQLPETGAAVARDGFGGGRRTAVVGGQWIVAGHHCDGGRTGFWRERCGRDGYGLRGDNSEKARNDYGCVTGE